METFDKQFTKLFKQLGLPSDPVGISRFIARNSPLASDIRLTEARFWTQSQSGFLHEAVQNDADWAAIVDALDVALRDFKQG